MSADVTHGPGRDAFAVLAADHRHTLDLVGELEDLVGPQVEPTPGLQERGCGLVDRLVRACSVHEAVEEEFFWPVVRQRLPDGEGLAATAIGQETEAKRLLAAVDGMPSDRHEFPALVSGIARAVRLHVAYEQEQVWPHLRAALSDQEAVTLGRRLADARKRAPTRPHPHTPPVPVVLRGMGPIVAVSDRIRDAISGRRGG